MFIGEIRSKLDQVWNAFWAGGIANPLEVIEQITYLLFMRGLDDIQTREENKANMLGHPMERMIFPSGIYRQDRDGNDITYEELRWSKLKNADPQRMFMLMSDFIFPFMREMAEEGTAHSEHMKGAVYHPYADSRKPARARLPAGCSGARSCIADRVCESP